MSDHGPQGVSALQRARLNIPAPKGIVLSDLGWVSRVAERYGMDSLDLSSASVVLERTVSAGGRCFCYSDGSWLIGLSLPRFQRCGRHGMEGILAHELLHAWLWSQHRYTGHGQLFGAYASARGIPRWCSGVHEVLRQGPQQLLLFDA